MEVNGNGKHSSLLQKKVLGQFNGAMTIWQNNITQEM
jgi:hypothetical protein